MRQFSHIQRRLLNWTFHGFIKLDIICKSKASTLLRECCKIQVVRLINFISFINRILLHYLLLGQVYLAAYKTNQLLTSVLINYMRIAILRTILVLFTLSNQVLLISTWFQADVKRSSLLNLKEGGGTGRSGPC